MSKHTSIACEKIGETAKFVSEDGRGTPPTWEHVLETTKRAEEVMRNTGSMLDCIRTTRGLNSAIRVTQFASRMWEYFRLAAACVSTVGRFRDCEKT